MICTPKKYNKSFIRLSNTFETDGIIELCNNPCLMWYIISAVLKVLYIVLSCFDTHHSSATLKRNIITTLLWLGHQNNKNPIKSAKSWALNEKASRRWLEPDFPNRFGGNGAVGESSEANGRSLPRFAVLWITQICDRTQIIKQHKTQWNNNF